MVVPLAARVVIAVVGALLVLSTWGEPNRHTYCASSGR